MSRATHQIHKFEPGQCVCLLGDPGAGAQSVNVRKLSGSEAVLDPEIPLEENRFVYATLKLKDGPSLALSGLVVTSASGGILIQWSHSNPREADRIDETLQAYVDGRWTPQAPQPKAAPAPTRPPVKAPVKAPARAPAPAPPKTPVHNQAPSPADGALSVDDKVRKKAKRVRSSDLASRCETVQVLNMETIHALVQEGVNEALAMHGSSLAEADRQRIIAEAEASFAERFSLFKAEKSGLETQIQKLQEGLKKAQGLLEEERVKVLSANQFTVSDAGMVELEQRLGRLLERAIKVGNVSPELAEDMRAVVVKLLDDERAKIHEQAQEAQSDRLQLLERKVQRLASSLESAEAERDMARERAQALEAAGGIPLRNIMKAGLDTADPNRNRKLGLLKEIFESNQEIRRKLAAEGRLPHPRRAEGEAPASPAPAPAEAEPPQAEEARLAKELGVERREVVVEEDPASAPQLIENDTTGNEEKEEAAAVPVLALGPDADPDDMLWEPPEETASESESRVAFKKLGSGS